MTQGRLFGSEYDDRGILDSLSPVWAEKWEEEGLFLRTQYDNVDSSERQKKKFCIELHTQFWRTGSRKLINAIPDSRSPVSPMDADYQFKEWFTNKFYAITNREMRMIIAEMILSEFPSKSARHVAKKNNYEWETFRNRVNYGVHELKQGRRA